MAKRGALVVLVVLLAASCGGSDEADGPPVLLVASAGGVSVLDSETSTLGPPAPRAVTSPDGELLVRADFSGTSTRVRAVDLPSGDDAWTATIDGSFEPRTVAVDGALVAFTPPPGQVAPGALAPGRRTTDVVVLHAGAVDTYEVDGNVEPEAFSVDGHTLFVVEYIPPTRPTQYQVRRLDLASGELSDVASPDAELHGAMGGTARTHAWDPDGTRLYTLYTQPVGATTTAFVHVLDLEEKWAHCILLPDGFTPATGGLVLGEGGKDLFVGDAAAGLLVQVDTQALDVVEERPLPGTSAAYATPMAVVADELYVGAGTDLLRLDRATLDMRETLHVGVDLVGVQSSGALGSLYVASPGAVLLLDLTSGETVERILPDAALGSFASFGARAVPTYPGLQCAC